MEHSREFYKGVIRVIDYLQPDVWDVMPEKGEELAGNYWPEVGRMLKEDYDAGWFDHGRFHITRRQKLPPLREDCLLAIENIDKADFDRNLSNTEKVENIKYGKKAYKLSKVAIFISSVALLIEIMQLILEQLL